MRKKVTIPYFPKPMRYATFFIFAAAIYLVGDHLVWSAVLFLSGLIILTTHYITVIDLDKKQYNDYVSFMGMKLDEDKATFTKPDRIVITTGNYAQTLNTRIQTRTMEWMDYTGTLVFDDDNALDLLTRNNKKELVKGLKQFADFLNVGIEDRTTRDHYWVDLTKADT